MISFVVSLLGEVSIGLPAVVAGLAMVICARVQGEPDIYGEI